MELNNPEYFSDGQPPLNLPPFQIKLKKEKGFLKIYDRLRDKYVVLSPEEYVRQHFVNYMISYLHYPASIMANEVGIELNGTLRRCDTVVFNNAGRPDLIVEYKAPSVTINQNVFDQIVRYNMKLMARYLVVSNGMNHYCCVIDYRNNTYQFIPRIPDYFQYSSN